MLFSGAKMIQNASRGLCSECNEGIFNPICPVCLAGEIQVWAGSSLNAKTADQISTFAKKAGNKFFDEGADCAICRKNQAGLCPYCFTNRIYNFLNKLKVSKKVIEEFLTHFNYDFDHKGYSKRFEEDFEK